jgi:hypothetical protein
MTRRHSFALRALLFVAPSLLVAACSAEGPSSEETTRGTADELSQIKQLPHRGLCPDTAAPGHARCFARVRTDSNGQMLALATPQGITPANLRAAYNLPASGGAGRTIAIVDAQDDPKAEADMGAYRAQFGLPACTTTNGCFKKVNQNGVAGSYPAADTGWAGEIALDLDMASAVCPDCKILLVEASTSSMADLGAAVNTAVALGAAAVSNSYGGSEDSSTASDSAKYFNHPGVLITASSGDSGYGVSFPASSQYVTAVGGTSLVTSTGTTRGWKEGAWSGAGSGCSAYIAKPSWQKDTGCAKRTVADVSAVADPNTGVAVYDTYGGNGWEVVGGTSASSPIIASIYALTNHAKDDASYDYAHTTAFYDVASGKNGSCSGSYLCTSVAGYDGPTGLGSPNGGTLASGGGGGGTDAGTGGTDAGGGTDSGGGGGSTCSHATCTAGTKLVTTCDPCVAKICASDSYCCATQWDSQCVGEVASICGTSCTGGGGGGSTCTHDKCAQGTKLTGTCDTCVAKVCASDSYCCNTKWDSQCVGEVASVCNLTCN